MDAKLDHIRSLEQQYLFPTYSRQPVLLERGKGVFVFDSAGTKYLDAITGIGVNAMGHAHPKVLEAIKDQSRKLIHTSNLYYNEFQGPLAERLTRLSGMERAFFTVSGAEAAEGAIKVARAVAQRIAPDKIELIALDHSFHGRTTGAVSVTGTEKYRAPFGPLLPGVRFVPANDQAALAAAVNARTAAILIEPVQGEGGIREIDPAFLAAAADLARQHQALLIADEIQCGLGRTGKAFAFQWTSVIPDIVIAAKPIACGYPLGVILARGEAATALTAGSHGTTFGGGPMACRLGMVFLDFLDQESTYTHIQLVGAGLKQGMQELAARQRIVREVRGKGLMLAMELDRPAAPAARRMLELGMLVNVTHENIIRLLPPYILEPKHGEKIVRALGKALKTADWSASS
ncbi:MAG: aspartate aminotransferase family protein [Terriglobales bacterium]